MTTDIIDMNNFVVLIEQSNAENVFIQRCTVDGEVVGFAFYGSGNVELEIRHNGQTKIVTNTTGMAISFFGNNKVEFAHKIAPDCPLQSISVFTKIRNLHAFTDMENEMFHEHLQELLHPPEDFVKGPRFYMTRDMQNAVQKILHTQYTGNTRRLFLKSQINELLAHFFALLGTEKVSSITDADKKRLFQAKEIISSNLVKPPSLSELSKMIGLNNHKLKKNFREFFGMPVFKFLQEERLNKAYQLLTDGEMAVQEIAWYVGYESLSSFSNAFHKKFSRRPNEIRRLFFSNKS